MYISIYFYTHMRILKILMRVNIFIRRPSGNRHTYTRVHLQLLWYSVYKTCIRYIYNIYKIHSIHIYIYIYIYIYI